VLRQVIALLSVPLIWGQQRAIGPVKPDKPVVVRPYLPVEVPPVRLSNSDRLSGLIRAGALYLTAQVAVALALENNIDLEIARYNPLIAEWRVVRAEAGGALPGVPSAAAQAGTVAAGQGVSGSQAAAGVFVPGARGTQGQGTNATITQIGPVTQPLDPTLQETSTFTHTTSPQPNIVQSITPVLISDTRGHSGSYQQGFLTGGSVTGRFTDNYLKENSPTNILNPTSAANLSLAAQHNFLKGFGIAVNARTITVAKMNIGITDLNFRNQVIALVTRVLAAYYNYAASYEDARAKRNAVQASESFFKDVNRQIELGSVAPPEAITTETQLVTSRQALVGADATLRQQETQLKNLLSRTGLSDAQLLSIRIVPLDRIVIPEKDDLPELDEMVKMALANRPDLAAQQENLRASEVNALGTRNGLLPTLLGFALMNNSGLAGTARVLERNGVVQRPDQFFEGNVGTALGQVFRRNFPTQRTGAFFQTQIRNRQAQADSAIDQLQIRQSELTTQRDRNGVQVDVLNYVVAIQQARARYEAAVRNRTLQEELVSSEEKRFSLGTSIPSNVTRQQRDLINAQSAEVAALVSWSNARIALDQTLGTTLERHNITITDARDGRVARTSTLPDVLPEK
jgi:outer membrane protein TolC